MDIKELLKRIDDGLAAERAKGEGASAATVTKLEAQKEALSTIGEHRELSRFAGKEASDLETIAEMARGGGFGRRGGLSAIQGKGWKAGHWSEAFVKAADGKSLTPSGRITVPSLSGGIVPISDRALRLIDVIPMDTLNHTDQFAYLRETKREHKASEVAPGALKPTSVYNVAKIEDRVRVIAHISEPMDRFLLRDVELLRPYIDDAMRQGVLVRLDQQILLGDGTGENLKGLGTDAERQQMVWETDLFTTTRQAVTLLEDLEIYSGIFVLSPGTWEELELTSTSVGDFYLGGPVDRAERKLWGRPVVVTSALNAAPNRGFFIDFEGSTELVEADSVEIDWSENVFDPDALAGDGASDFVVNQLRFRGEGRYGLKRKRPRGVVEFPTVE